VPRVKELAAKTKKVYGYHNNHPFGHAVESALKESELLGIAGEEQRSLQARVTRAIDQRIESRFGSVQGLLDPGADR